MSKWPMRGHFGHLHFKTFPMTLITPQGKVFCPLLLNSKDSGISEDSNSPTLGVWVSSSHLAKVGLRQPMNLSFFKNSPYQQKEKHAKVSVQLNSMWYSHLIISNFKPHALNLFPMENLKQQTWIQIANFQQWRLHHFPPTHVTLHPPPQQ